MRILVLETDSAAAELAAQLASSRGLELISLGERFRSDHDSPDLDQRLEQGAFVLTGDPATAEKAAALDTLLDDLAAPLELVIVLDDSRENPADLPPPTDPLQGYYRERGLLRRIRSEGTAAQRLAVAERVIDGLVRARQPESADPFAAALQAIVTEVPPEGQTTPAPTTPPATQERTESTEATPELAQEKRRAGPGWKRTAEKKGRLQRQQSRGKIGRKPRR